MLGMVRKHLGSFAVLHHTRLAELLPPMYYPYRVPGGRMYLDVSESPMMMARAFGLFEPDKHKAVRTFLEEGNTFIDIGANKGDFMLLAARLVGDAGQVLAFEPEPENQMWLQKSIDANEYNNIELVPAAVGAEQGVAQLFIGEKSGWHSIIPATGKPNRPSIPVDVIPLDHALATLTPRSDVDAIKIDVEGAELDVLRGAEDTLHANPDVVLLIDIHPHLGVDHSEVFDLLAAYGFSVFHERAAFDTPVSDDETPDAIVAYNAKETDLNLPTALNTGALDDWEPAPAS